MTCDDVGVLDPGRHLQAPGLQQLAHGLGDGLLVLYNEDGRVGQPVPGRILAFATCRSTCADSSSRCSVPPGVGCSR